MKTIKLLLITVFILNILLSCSKEDIPEPIVIIATPLVEFSYAPEDARAEQEINFNARFLTGSSVITSWNWSFGDAAQSVSGLQNTSFTYNTAGDYTVKLTASDKNDSTVTITKTITIKEALPDPFEATIAWSFTNETPVSNYNDGSSAPAIGDDGTIFYLESFAAAQSKLIAVTDQGNTASKKWEYAPGYNLRNAPSIGIDGNIFIGTWNAAGMRKVNAADGNEIEAITTGSGISNSTAAIDANGNVYVGTRSEGIFAWDSNGTLLWNFKEVNGTGYYASPVLSQDGSTLFALKTNAFLYAINTNDGTAKWEEPIAFTGDATGTSLSINADGTIYFTTANEVIAIEDKKTYGTLKWSTETNGANSSGVVIDQDENLYVGTSTGLLSLNPTDGTINWLYEASINESVPAIDSSGNIYTGTSNGLLLVLNNTGELLKQLNLTTNEVHSPVIADNGDVYVEGYDGSFITLFKITVNNSTGPAQSPWPMKGFNKKNTSFKL